MKYFTLAIRMVDERPERSAITECDIPDSPDSWYHPDKVNCVTARDAIRYFATSKNMLEAVAEGYDKRETLINPNYFNEAFGYLDKVKD